MKNLSLLSLLLVTSCASSPQIQQIPVVVKTIDYDKVKSVADIKVLMKALFAATIRYPDGDKEQEKRLEPVMPFLK